MTRYQKAMLLGDLRACPGWRDDGQHRDDMVCFLGDDSAVRASWNGDEVLFTGDPVAWRHTCREMLRYEPVEYRLHPLNRGFRWREATGPFRRLSPAQAETFDRDGFIVLESCFGEGCIAELVREIDRFEVEAHQSLQRLDRDAAFIARAQEITFTTHLARRSRRVREFCRSQLFCDVAWDLLGPDVRLYWDHAVYKKPHCRDPFPWHQDNGYTFVDPQQYLTFWIALTDVHEGNGCMQLLPGVHRLGTLVHQPTPLGHACFADAPPGTRQVTVRAGGVVVMSATTPHVTLPNLTDEQRRAYVVQFAPHGACSITIGSDGRQVREPCDSPDRQFRVLAGGVRVAHD